MVGLDNLNSYYSQQLKRDRLAILSQAGLEHHELDLVEREAVQRLIGSERWESVIHLAAQPGVRYSLENPFAYADSNLTGFLAVLEGCRAAGVRHLVYASSSSVYGANRDMPFSTRRSADHPLSLYGATKKANEMMAHAYAATFGLPVTGLRFFTVYGPWGRPDMAIYTFARRIVRGEPIQLFNHGDCRRDFTYVDDIVEGIVRISRLPPAPDPGWDVLHPDPSRSNVPYRVFNIGAHSPVQLEYFVKLIEEALERPAVREYLPLQPGDLEETCADVEDLAEVTGFRPQVSIEEGIRRSFEWYREYRLRNPEL